MEDLKLVIYTLVSFQMMGEESCGERTIIFPAAMCQSYTSLQLNKLERLSLTFFSSLGRSLFEWSNPKRLGLPTNIRKR
jgi:hypothetical protein